MKTLKKIGIAIVVIAVLAVAAFLILRKSEKPQMKYKTAEIHRGSIVNTVTATGTIEPIVQVEVGTQVSGIINHIYVDYNSVVKKGEVIAELDKTTLEADLASSSATLQSNKTEYEYQEKNFLRIKGLHEKKMVSDTDYETAEYQYNKAKSSYEKSQSDITKARQNLEYATIYSPIDGVVIDRAVEEGQTVAASFNTPTLFTIANDLRQMRVIADVDEADIGGVVEGQQATFTVDAFPEDVFKGSVTQVRLQPTTESNVVTYEVVVDAPNPDLKLKPGLTANLTIYTMQKDSVLLVPLKALRFLPENAPEPVADSANPRARVLWTQSPQGLQPVNVTTGDNDGIFAEITGDIKEGDKVVTGVDIGVASISDGQGEANPFMPSPPGARKNAKK
ncbi:efflux RND transporter periplasmic adaptor subunit [Alistipes sp. dk3620]|uniref:efflux RND transporter periplasmic adaptor subunit n=1 Tax=unclassified Alistipes TaxID=2608932 RepID=UPI001295DA41|nr:MULTISPECIES: efflux RND transporter periplasmic adaptor subunit [unclassified Alistipes]MQX27378.1 efflux RND transporter periplasmic adaptor subunit [Alistipes sp. dk3620]QGA22441.1 efflux RND transporter periplasmic adaptor subunit [Alistipes sp. dk3624]HIV59829.1 efflux RND transporter periplasmic adaptor subunit [Candidatus Alistipes pullistercoris]